MNLRRRAVRIGGQQDRGPAAIHVRDVHSAVGAHQPVPGFGDENVLFAHHTPGLAQRQLHHASIRPVVTGKTGCGSGWLHRIKRNPATFGFGYDLVLAHQDVAVVKAQAAENERVHHEASNRVAGHNVGNTEHRNGAQFAGLDSGRRWHQTAASHCASSCAPKPHERSNRCAWVLPSRCNSSSSSCGLSMSSPMPGISRTTSSLPVFRMASQCGRKLSLPKRSGMMAAGRRRNKLLPRQPYAGTTTAPSAGAASSTRRSSSLVMSGISPGTTMVVSYPRCSHHAVAPSIAAVSLSLPGAALTDTKRGG